MLVLKKAELKGLKKQDALNLAPKPNKKVNKSIWSKYMAYKFANVNKKYRNKIIDPHKRSYNIYQ